MSETENELEKIVEELKKRLGALEEDYLEETEPPKTIDSEPLEMPPGDDPGVKAGSKEERATPSVAGIDLDRVRAIDIAKTAEDYNRISILEAMILRGLNIIDVLNGAGGQPIYSGQEFTASDLSGITDPTFEDVKAQILHVSWISTGGKSAMILLVRILYKDRPIEETVITAHSSEEAKNTLKLLLSNYANRIKRAAGGGK